MTLERDEELERLLDVERTIPEPTGGMKERVLTSVLKAGVLTASVSGSGAEGVGDLAAASTGKLLVASLAFLGGSIFGAGVYHFVVDETQVAQTAEPTEAPQEEPALLPVPREPETETEAEETEPLEEEPPVMEEAVQRAPRRIETTPEIVEDSPAESALAQERALIDVARSALGRQRPASALAALERHAQRFPRGHLTQEREGLLVLAYARAGRMEQAQSAAEEFRRRYPRSLMLRTIETVLSE